MNAHTLPPKYEALQTLLAGLATIPAHDPTRYETTDGFDNPNCTNVNRASFASEALDSFQKACCMVEDIDTAASDLICDLLHHLRANNHDLLPILHNGIQDFLCEAGEILPIRGHSCMRLG